MASETVILIVLALNLIASIIIFAFQFVRNRRLAFICLGLGVFVPVIGLLMCMIMLIRLKSGRHEMEAGETIKKFKIQNVEYVDEERLRSVVPASDALSISDESERRSYLLGLLRQRDMSSLRDTLKMALTNKDSEASHYAASAIMELQRESYAVMSEKEKLYEAMETKTYDTAVSYAWSIMSYLESSEVGQLENYMFREKYENVMKDILESFPDKVQNEDFENLIDMFLKQGRLEEASLYADKYLQQLPMSENSYVYIMKTAYARGDNEKFNKALEGIRASKVVLSPETLTLVRFWIEAKKTGNVNED